jgi:hypothetical protein
MARGWSFIGGLLIVTTVTYLNMSQIKAAAQQFRTLLAEERRKLENARNDSTPTTTGKADVASMARTTRVVERIKKIWNEDIEHSVRRIQNTDWEATARAVQTSATHAVERLRRIGEDSKKKST